MSQPVISFRRYMALTALSAAAVCAIAFAVNAVVDPLWHFGGNRFSGVNPHFNERLSKINLLKRRMADIDCVIFGSSRGTLMPGDAFAPHHCFNLSFASGQIEEFIAYADYLRHLGILPKLVVIGVDGFNFLREGRDPPSIPDFVRTLRPPPGVMDLREERMRVFSPGEDRNRKEDEGGDEIIDGIANPVYEQRFGAEYTHAKHDIELVREAAPSFDEARFLEGRQTPMFFGSAINNFGVREVLDALVDLAPPPGERAAIQRVVQPDEPKFSGVVFKIQANMDPAHRDRIAFLRVASGHFERGMRLKVTRSGKELRPNTVVSFLSQRRELLDEAFAGDIIGIPNHGVLQLGDTLTEGEALQFTGLPFFAPEMFRSVEVADPLKTKQLKAGLTQLGEEGAIQVFRPVAGSVLLLGAVGQLQFEVVAHRLEHEYGCKARITPSRYQVARWVTSDDPKELQRFIDANAHRVAYDAVDAPTVLVEYAPELRAIESNWPKIRFHALREHAGLVFQRQLSA